MNAKRFALMVAFIVLILVIAQPVTSQESEMRVALVVVGEDEQPRTACILPEQDAPTGYDVLVASGLTVNASVGPLGVAVCSIDELGCSYPAQTCFCECSGGRCAYWSYHYREAGQSDWVYSQVSAGTRQVKDGDVELWVWLTPDNEDAPLPEMTWEQICGDVGETQSLASENEAEEDKSPLQVVGYIAFGAVAAGIVAGVLWERRRKA